MAGVGSGADAGGSARVGMGAVTRPDAVDEVERHGGGGGGTAALAYAALGEEEMLDAEVGEAERLDLNIVLGTGEDLSPVQPQEVAVMQVRGFFQLTSVFPLLIVWMESQFCRFSYISIRD